MSFLEARASRRAKEERFVWGRGRDAPVMFETVDRDRELKELETAKEWRRAKYDAGFGWIFGPVALGGGGMDQSYQVLWDQLESRYDVPSGSYFGIGLGMVAPTILAHASPEVAADLLPKLYRADLVGCQLFSEPGAGSDLASLRMRAERDGDEWILNGQKVWTSGAHYSDIGEVIARTDPDKPKHRGLTAFLVDMKAPGVDVRPLRQMTGGANFNEVFFTDVRVPDSWRLGEVNDGWRVALTTLMNERASIGGGGVGGGGAGMDRLIEMARHFGLNGDPLVRQGLSRVHIEDRVRQWTSARVMASVSAGRTPGPELSIGKLGLIRTMQATCDLVGRILGLSMVVDTGEWGTFNWSGYVLGAPAMRIAGGSDETLRNIIGERVLGLPKEPGIDTTSPYRDLKVGTPAG
ncbi:MAG TPA: acyl-CoA dehydrogenase family protein [Acidimicrobiales bacterium]|nr:acyl-CoA dehydrogenase family protein [Acidimicrobiales bacterium]